MKQVISFVFQNIKFILFYSFSVIKKDQFKEMKNDHLELEPFVECTDCGRKLHQICVLHMENIWPIGYDNILVLI